MEKQESRKSFSDVLVCPSCGGEDCYPYNDDETEFSDDATGHYYADCHCTSCGKNFRLCIEFEYTVTKHWTRD